mmetsp:Transcript_104853/g.165513  ORF Transcript_104853/g.165513 Transcript_104853/m.165513 type:complete len:555 (-) Transcript_104853:287-1951(-)
MGISGSSQSGNYLQLSDSESEIWQNVPLFKCLPKELYPQLRECSIEVTFKAGEAMVRQDEKGDEFFIIRDGQARVEVDGETKATLGSGDYFGENALLNQVPRTASVIAVEEIKAVKIHRTDFQRLNLHTRLNFPRRGKKQATITKRHQMMAGVAGIKATAEKRRSSAFVGSVDLMKMETEQLTWYQVQKGILWHIFSDRINVTAFVFVPLGQICKYMDMSAGVVFASNFLAIIPLASILGQATEALATHTGQLVGGLLNATFGNAVEMIMCMQAVKAGLIKVVQSNLLGSILSNLLLVLGMAIFASGTARKTQKFNQQGAASNMTCQLVASISVCLPTVFACVTNYKPGSVLTISRICAAFLMLVYGTFLFFMLKTHADLFSDEDDEEHEDNNLSPALSVLLLLATTLAVFFCSECLVDSIEGVSVDMNLSKAFIGVILLPIVGNAAEHATAVTSAYKGMMDLALGVAVGSSTQIALFVVPCAILFGWWNDQPMNLDFTAFDTTCQMLTVFLVSQVLSHGETTWVHGVMLMTVYCFIAIQTLFILEEQPKMLLI